MNEVRRTDARRSYTCKMYINRKGQKILNGTGIVLVRHTTVFSADVIRRHRSLTGAAASRDSRTIISEIASKGYVFTISFLPYIRF